MPRAFITGISGQDGSHLAEFLLNKGYEVSGLVRRSSVEDFPRLESFRDRIQLFRGDVLDSSSLIAALEMYLPDEIYNLAAMSFVSSSWQQPTLTSEVTGLGVLRLLEAMRQVCPKARFYQASSSEMFGLAAETPQRETTPFHPRSPYGVAKVFGHGITVNYRESYDLFTCSGILFNHEGPRRGLDFVTRKITHTVARIKLGLESRLALGNLQAKRDWGYAGDYVQAMWLMLQQDNPDDYVIGTGEARSVKEFVELAFAHVDLDWRQHVVIDAALFRPADVAILQADASKARRLLHWEPEVTFEELVKMMVDADLEAVRGQEKERAKPQEFQGALA